MMRIEVEISGKTYSADIKNGFDLSIPVGKQDEVNAYGLPQSKIEVFEAGGFIGDVNQGGSCNVRSIYMQPHGNGTHTECRGHISEKYMTIYETLNNFLFTATLITLSVETCIEPQDLTDLKTMPGTDALIIRTQPNSPNKLGKNYLGSNPVYISEAAMGEIVDLNYQHLLIDLPSVDHETDPHLKSHHIFWADSGLNKIEKTITELIYVNNDINDGLYLLNLMVPSIYCDAVPSKPIVYPLR